MTESSEPFLSDGISLGIPNTSSTDIEQIDNVIFLDENGELQFRDDFVKNLKDVNGNPVNAISLRDLYTKSNGIFVSNGQLYFKDSSVSKAYSLKELVGAYIDWKNKITTGGIFWIGSTKITEIDCNNVKINVEGNPNLGVNTSGVSGDGRVYTKVGDDYSLVSSGTKVFSFDQFATDFVPELGETFRLNADSTWKWHDVPSLKILIPPVDETKTMMIVAKSNVRLIRSGAPIVLRLYDKTTSTEIDRKSVGNDSDLPVEQQPILSFVGVLPTFKAKLEAVSCDCPTNVQETSLTEEPPHEIVVQFHIDDHFEDIPEDQIYNTKIANISGSLYTTVNDPTDIRFSALERRLIGLPNTVSDEPLVNSSIDILIFDTTKRDNFGRKTGSETFKTQDMKEVTFATAFTNADYSISLTCDKNINIWYTNKRSTGFTIRSEKKMAGTVDWIATKLRFEGEA